ncbi:MAG: hypothetical protein ACREUC_20830 [Steroidobacteraceae bacterium]
MPSILKTFLEIAVWRKGPQDLPASNLLALLALATYAAVEFVAARLVDFGARAAVVLIVVDVVMLSAWLWLVLSFFARRQRFIQTITATLGVLALIIVLDISVVALQLALGLDRTTVAINWLLPHIIILALVLGRIFMQALDRGLITGMALTVAIIYSTELVSGYLLDNIGRTG